MDGVAIKGSEVLASTRASNDREFQPKPGLPVVGSSDLGARTSGYWNFRRTLGVPTQETSEMSYLKLTMPMGQKYDGHIIFTCD